MAEARKSSKDVQRLVERMRPRWSMLVVGLGISLSVLSCAPTKPRPFLLKSAAGHRAYDAGRYEEAATKFRKAAGLASAPRDRDEYLYLEAAAHERAGRWRLALQRYQELLRLSPNGERAARCAYQIAQIQLDRLGEAQGYRALDMFVKTYPTSGLARRGLLQLVDHEEQQRGPEAAIDYLRSRLSWCDRHGLGEQARYELARRLDEAGKLSEARDAYVECARRYPYPKGLLFDDAIYAAAQLDRKLGQPHEAVRHLRWLLSYREKASFTGSYERPKYPKAQMLIAETYRDDLHDRKSARREFRRLYRSFQTSTLRDDAMWQVGLLAKKDGLQHEVCEAMQTLVRDLPDSRYAPCAQTLCPTLKEHAKGECHRYILRQMRSE